MFLSDLVLEELVTLALGHGAQSSLPGLLHLPGPGHGLLKAGVDG